MKKDLLIVYLLTCSAGLFSQINITKAHIGGAGRRFITATHDGEFPLPPSGANQTWDFTFLNQDYLDTMDFMEAASCPGYSFFPQANIAARVSWDDSLIAFASINDSNLRSYGDYELGHNSKVTYSNSIALTFPSTYQTSFTQYSPSWGVTFQIGYDPDGAGSLPFIDSIQAEYTQYKTSKISGWGSIKTAIGTYQALQQTETMITTPYFLVYSQGVPSHMSYEDLKVLGSNISQPDSSCWVSYYTNNATVGYTIVSYGYNKGDTTVRDAEWLYNTGGYTAIGSLQTSNIRVYPNPVSDKLTISGISGTQQVRMYDLQGLLLIDQTMEALNGTFQISSEFLNNGLYLLEMTDSNSGKIEILKIVKQ